MRIDQKNIKIPISKFKCFRLKKAKAIKPVEIAAGPNLAGSLELSTGNAH
jgi:hypothetical protein